MKAALLNDYHQPLELIDRPVPEPARPDQVCVKIEGAGVCATDLHAIEGLMGPAGFEVPRVLGHENAGSIAAVGDLVTTVKVGDPVLVYPAYSCGLCVACRRGDDIHCDHHQFTGLTQDGGFTEYLVVYERQLIPLPPGVDPVAVAPHSDAGITAYHAVKKLAPKAVPGTDAVMIGIGGVGHIALQVLKEIGSSRVIAVESDAGRRDLATELGADEVLDAGNMVEAVRDLTGGRGADLVFDFVGTDETHAAGMDMLARAGTYSIIGYGGTLSVPTGGMVGQEHAAIANLVGSWTDLWELMELHGQGKITLKTETYPLDQINEVMDRLREGKITGRAVLAPGGGA